MKVTLESVFPTTITNVTAADRIEESENSGEFLALQVGVRILEDYGETPTFVAEAVDGWVVTGDTNAIFMGSDGSVEIEPMPEGWGDESDPTTDPADSIDVDLDTLGDDYERGDDYEGGDDDPLGDLEPDLEDITDLEGDDFDDPDDMDESEGVDVTVEELDTLLGAVVDVSPSARARTDLLRLWERLLQRSDDPKTMAECVDALLEAAQEDAEGILPASLEEFVTGLVPIMEGSTVDARIWYTFVKTMNGKGTVEEIAERSGQTPKEVARVMDIFRQRGDVKDGGSGVYILVRNLTRGRKSLAAHDEEATTDLEEAKWSGKVTPKWSPPEGLFKQASAKIAETVGKASGSLRQAVSRINFYLNRAGANLPEEDKTRIRAAIPMLKAQFTEALGEACKSKRPKGKKKDKDDDDGEAMPKSKHRHQTDLDEVRRLDNSEGLAKGYNSWREFLSQKGQPRAQHKKYAMYTVSNTHYIVHPDGQVEELHGFHGPNRWKQLTGKPIKGTPYSKRPEESEGLDEANAKKQAIAAFGPGDKGIDRSEAVSILRGLGYSDNRLRGLMSKAGLSDEEIGGLLKEADDLEEDGMLKPVPGRCKIAVKAKGNGMPQQSKMVQGWSVGPFFVSQGVTGLWRITHKQTGMALSTAIRDKKAGVQAATKLAKRWGDTWNFAGPQGAKKAMAGGMAGKVLELLGHYEYGDNRTKLKEEIGEAGGDGSGPPNGTGRGMGPGKGKRDGSGRGKGAGRPRGRKAVPPDEETLRVRFGGRKEEDTMEVFVAEDALDDIGVALQDAGVGLDEIEVDGPHASHDPDIQGCEYRLVLTTDVIENVLGVDLDAAEGEWHPMGEDEDEEEPLDEGTTKPAYKQRVGPGMKGDKACGWARASDAASTAVAQARKKQEKLDCSVQVRFLDSDTATAAGLFLKAGVNVDDLTLEEEGDHVVVSLPVDAVERLATEPQADVLEVAVEEELEHAEA